MQEGYLCRQKYYWFSYFSPIFWYKVSYFSYFLNPEFPIFLSNHAAGHPEKFLWLQKQPQLISLRGRRSIEKERGFQAREKCEGRARKQATTSLKHLFLRGHNNTTCLVFFLICFNAKSVGEEIFKYYWKGFYQEKMVCLGSRDLEELPKSIYSLLWFQLTVQNKLLSSTKTFVKGRYKF